MNKKLMQDSIFDS